MKSNRRLATLFRGWAGWGALAGLLLAPVGGAKAQVACLGDCSGDGAVTVNELVMMVNIAVGQSPVEACAAADPDGDGFVFVNDVIAAVNFSLTGCPTQPSPSPTATETPVQTPSVPVPTPVGSGVKSALTTASIGADGTVSVDFSLRDESGVALTPVLGTTQNASQARIRVTLAHIETYSGGGEFNSEFRRYVNSVNRARPNFDSGGTIVTVDGAQGLYRYVFRTKVPDAVPGTTYMVAMQVDRTVDGRQQSSNPILDFVVGGGTPEVLAAATTEACNSCHGELVFHGNRREFRLCTSCHTQDLADEKGTSLSLPEMIHKIHRGKDLPSIVNGEPGARYAIYSSRTGQYDVFAEKKADGTVEGVGYPRDLRNCTSCHVPEAPTADHHQTMATTAACASCHDNVNPSNEDNEYGPAGLNHFQGRGFADGDCSFCHVADSGAEFDISVAGAHTVPARSRQLQGIEVSVVGVEATAGEAPVISFRATDKAGNSYTSFAGFNRVAFVVAGPTSDYQTQLAMVAAGSGATGTLTGPDENGIFRYAATTRLPADAAGTWAIGTEARRAVTLPAVSPIQAKSVNEVAANEVVTFTVDGSTPEVRRIVSDDQLCGSCHGTFSKDFSVHGGLRNSVEHCVLCHNPNLSDFGRRRNDAGQVNAGAATETMDFKVMVHKIHFAENLSQPYVVYGFGAAPANFTRYDLSHLRFPGDMADCSTCHVGNSHLIPPFPGSAVGTRQTRVVRNGDGTISEVFVERPGPMTSVCTSCHDSAAAQAHARTQATGDGIEACTICHSEGRSVPVSAAHAR